MNNVAFTFGGVAIYWYGILVATGFLLGLWTASRRAIRAGVNPEAVVDLGPWLIVGALLGARSLFVLSYWREQFASQPWTEIFMIRKGGLVFYGGLIGGSLAVVFYCRAKKLDLWRLADVLAPSISLGQVFGRLGCLMNGCCYGRETHLPWAFYYPETHPTYPQGIHPTQIYESALSLGLYISLACYFRLRKFDGQVFALYLVGYALLRAFVENFRGDYRVYYLHSLTPAQLVSVAILAGGILLWWKLPKQLAAATPSD